jgi:hypothetical protein
MRYDSDMTKAATAADRTTFALRVKMVDRNDRVGVVQKAFRTAAARDKWLDRNDGNVVEVLAQADPE